MLASDGACPLVTLKVIRSILVLNIEIYIMLAKYWSPLFKLNDIDTSNHDVEVLKELQFS